jgi:DNA mismatch repair ATPase MutS
MIAMEMERLFVNWANGIYLDTFRFSDLGYFYNLFFEGAEHAADNGSADFSDKDN